MAESLLRRYLEECGIEATVHSAGLVTEDQPASPHAVDVLKDRGLDLSAHRSRRLVADLLQRADLVLAMERAHLREAVLLDPGAFPKIFTLKELVRRGETLGAREEGEPLGLWLQRLHAGRRPADHLGASTGDDVADPIGRSRSHYGRTAAELDDLISRAVELVFRCDATIIEPTAAG